MTLQEIQQAVYHLTGEEQAKLLETLKDAMNQGSENKDAIQGNGVKDRLELVKRLRGCLKKTGMELSDQDVERMREERLADKFPQFSYYRFFERSSLRSPHLPRLVV